MIPITAYAALIDGVAALGFLLVGLRMLSSYHAQLIRDRFVHRLHLLAMALTAGALIAIGALSFLLLNVSRSHALTRFAHTVYLLSLWLLAVLLLFTFLVALRFRRFAAVFLLAGLAFLAPALIALASLETFTEVFGPLGVTIPLAVGVVQSVGCIAVLIAAQRFIHSSVPTSTSQIIDR